MTFKALTAEKMPSAVFCIMMCCLIDFYIKNSYIPYYGVLSKGHDFDKIRQWS
jgi:hypothetical protein